MTDIAVCVPLSVAQFARLQAGVSGLDVQMVARDTPCSSPIIFGNPRPEVVVANANLRWLQLESVGFGEYAALDWSRGHGPAQVTNLAGFFSDPVAESALAGILALYRRMDQLFGLQAQRQWDGDAVRTRMKLLRGARVVLFGYGAINRRLGELLTAFECQITPIARGWTNDSLGAALDGADIIVCTVPSTTATANLFDAARLAQLPRGAVFCNFGRGSLVDEPALDRALRSGHLAGAVIDVTRQEPLPADHPFWSCPNLILTQHSGGGSADELDRKVDVFLANLARYRSGQPLTGLVDFTRGY